MQGKEGEGCGGSKGGKEVICMLDKVMGRGER